MSRRISNGSTVRIAYVLTDDEGNTLDERTPETPLVFVQGEGQVLLAIERAVDGQTPGFAKSMRLDPKEAYGPYKPDLVVEIPAQRLPKGMAAEIGMKFDTQGPDGKPLVVRVIDFDDETVTLDGNHPLAGIALNFDLRVLDVRDAEDDQDSEETDDPFSSVTPPRRRDDMH